MTDFKHFVKPELLRQFFTRQQRGENTTVPHDITDFIDTPLLQKDSDEKDKRIEELEKTVKTLNEKMSKMEEERMKRNKDSNGKEFEINNPHQQPNIE